MIPAELNAQHIIKAIQRCLKRGIPRRRRSTKHCLVYEGRHYAPKYVISEACRTFYPDGLDPYRFSGGPETNTVLEQLGFTVVPCHCGGLVMPAQTAAVTVMPEAPAVTTPTASGVIVTGCVASDGYASGFGQRIGLLKAMLPAIHTAAGDSPFMLVLPAGYFDAGRKEPQPLYQKAAGQVASLLVNLPAGSTVCFGVDGLDGHVQLGVAVTRDGVIALGRKFYPAPGEENLAAADTPYSLEEGHSRTFRYAGRTYYLSVCYDTFGLKKWVVPNNGVDGIIGLVHGFAAPGQPGSGAGYFARYGFAGASKAWGCPVYGAAVFEGKVQGGWPTAVAWNKGAIEANDWTYADNPLVSERVEEVTYGPESAVLSFYQT